MFVVFVTKGYPTLTRAVIEQYVLSRAECIAQHRSGGSVQLAGGGYRWIGFGVVWSHIGAETLCLILPSILCNMFSCLLSDEAYYTLLIQGE